MIDLRLGDNLETLKTLGDGSVDAVVTDPPYQVELNQDTCAWDQWPGAGVWAEIARVVKPDGLLAFSIAPHVAHERVPDVAAAGWDVLEVGFWVWGSGRPVCETRLKRSYDLIYFMGRDCRDLFIEDARGAYKAGAATGKNERGAIVSSENTMGRMFQRTGVRHYEFGGDYHPANVACLIDSLAFGDSGYERIFAVKRVLQIGGALEKHPTQKPVDLVAQIVKLVSQPGDLVLDPWMGGGTTGVACVALQRDFIGVDIVADYVELARARLDGVQIEMFAGEMEERCL